VIGNIITVVIVFAVLIFIHELGHLLACKMTGIKVEKFSLGFGPPLVQWKRAETTYMISAVPLGGYIKMEGEDYGSTGFFAEPLGKKILVLTLGPACNLILGFVLVAILFTGFGMNVPKPYISPDEGSLGERAGLMNGDLVLTLDRDTVKDFADLDRLLLAQKDTQMVFRVRRDDGIHEVKVNGDPDSLSIGAFILPVVGNVKSDGPAAGLGLKRGDVILRLGTVAIRSWDTLVKIIRQAPGQDLPIKWLRGQETLAGVIRPKLGRDLMSGDKVGQIGIEHMIPKVPIPFGTAVWEAFKRTGRVVVQTFVILYQIVTGQVSARAISGPVMVAKIAYEGAQWGAEMLLLLWAVLSINLFVINMLPVPFLDGGRAYLFVFEAIRRKKLTARQWEIALRIGLHLVVMLVLFALSNDFLNMANVAAKSQTLTRKIQLGLVLAYAVYAIVDVARVPPAKKAEPPAPGHDA
jgi:regulator of sigma E protease